jgi:hypothetical protein
MIKVLSAVMGMKSRSSSAKHATGRSVKPAFAALLSPQRQACIMNDLCVSHKFCPSSRPSVATLPER